MSEDATWRAQRRDAAEEQVAALQRRKERETEQARVIVADFVRAAREQGLRPTELRATAYSGTRYKTPLTGWYLKRDETLAVGTDGEFYLLTVAASVRARLRGVTPEPYDPPLQVGAGGRDGDSIALTELLALRLAAGDEF